MKALNLACRIGFEIAIVLFVALAMLAPLEAIQTRHLNVVQTIDTTHAIIAGDVPSLQRGDDVPLYRLNSGWKAPILHATVEEVRDGSVLIAVDLATMSYPLGRTGTVSVDEDGVARVSLGEEHGITESTLLNLFRDRILVGESEVVALGEESSTIRVPASVGDADGLVASEYTYATQAAIAASPLIHTLETLAIAALLALYAYVFVGTKRSPFLVLGERLRRVRFPQSLTFWSINILASVPFIWFVGTMPLYLIAYLASIFAPAFGTTVFLYPNVYAMLPYVYGFGAMCYFGYLGYTRRSPVLAFWRLISYKGTSPVSKPTFLRGLWLWALHLIIVYAFGSTLWGFLIGNLGAAAAIGFPARTLEANFEYLKFIIWSLTIVGVLIGYGYSVVSILWGKYIRNLDFTIVGWLTNGFCYPLFGVVIWQMTPSFVGPDPIVTGGPLLYLMLFLGLFLNIIYMLSIFNLGILFDLMTDKGVRTSGFYSLIRHPNYTLEACMFFSTELVALSSGMHWLALSMFFFLYWIRSEREDNFMQYSNPEYREYQKRTPYKFLPGIY